MKPLSEAVEATVGRQGVQISLSVLLQIIAFLVMLGYTWASFQTKAEAKVEMDALKKEFMPRELSDERWKTNDLNHRRIERKLDAIMDKFKIAHPKDEDEAKTGTNQ